MGWVTGILGVLFKSVLGSIFGHKDPSVADLADSNARAQERLGQQEAANAVVTNASTARADADAVIVRDVQQGPEANAALKRDFPGDFRD